MQWKGEPKGDKLAGKTLVVTGTLETLSRNETEALIVKTVVRPAVLFQRKRPMSWQARQQAPN